MRVGSASQYREAVLGGGGGSILAQPQQLAPRRAGIVMRLGRDLDLGLQEFALDTARGAEIRRLEQRVGRLGRCLEGPRIGQKIFFLDAEAETIVGADLAR